MVLHGLIKNLLTVLATTNKVNQVATLAVAAAELLEFGQTYMAQIVANTRAFGATLEARGIEVLAAHKGYTTTHQVIGNVHDFRGGLEVAHDNTRRGRVRQNWKQWIILLHEY